MTQMYAVSAKHLDEIFPKVRTGLQRALVKGGSRDITLNDVRKRLEDEEAVLFVSKDFKVAYIVTFLKALDGIEGVILAYYADDRDHSYKDTIYDLASELSSKIVRLVGYSQRKAIARAIPGAKITRYEFVLEID